MLRRRAKVSSGLFSDVFTVRRKKRDDWFDPVLSFDTKLFVDPFLLFIDKSEWSQAHADLIAYFDRCFTLIARSGANTKSIQYVKAVSLLRFPEPKEFCLGYVREGTAGAGAGRGHAEGMAQAVWEAIRRGVKHPAHFEELGIFNEGIGPDRISDMTCNILRPRFIRYTQEVARRHHLKLRRFELGGGEFDEARKRWRSRSVLLPENPYNGGPVLLVPRRFLRDLPVLNAYDWWESSEADELRNDLNLEVMAQVDKATIIDLARKHPDSVASWVRNREQGPASPYDLDEDPNGVYQWAPITTEFARKNPLSLRTPSAVAQFMETVAAVMEQYRLFIEERGGWRLLWNDDRTEKPEEAAQLAFLGLARAYCEANGIVVDREVQLGRGPVDFKFSNGYAARALLEMKKLHNGRFWNGFHKQLPSYMRSDACDIGWFAAIQYRGSKTSRERAKILRRMGLRELGSNVRVVTIDGRRKRSASKL